MKNILITTTSNISKHTYDYICDGFKQKFGENCVFRHIVNEDIIGGFVANVNGEIFDLSISTQLKLMEQHIVG